MGDTLVAVDRNWLKLTVHAMQDFTFSLSVCWITGTVCHTVCAVDVKTVNAFKSQLKMIGSKQMDFFMDNWSTKSIGCQYCNFAVNFL